MDLRTRGIDEVQAADLHVRLATFAEEWGSPEKDLEPNRGPSEKTAMRANRYPAMR
jgi:hypothetical protein